MNLLLILIVTLFLSSSAFAWTWTADFESGTLGQVASGTSGFDYAASLTTYSNEQTHGGTKACKMHWTSGSDGEGCAGWWGYDDGNHNITNGQELWVRGYYYFKSSWDWTCDPAVKILRAPVRTSSNGHIGYISVLNFQNGEYSAESPGAMGYSNETTNGEGQSAAVPNALFSTDQWICLEMYIKFSPTAGIQRIWRNGILVQERTDSTFDATSNISPGGGWVMSYWNGGTVQTQDMYLDDFQATTDTPSNRDAAGNPMIGPIDWSSSDTTAPTVSITTSSPQTITSDSLTVIGTASDAVGVTSCKYRIGSEPGASAGTACTGTTSWTCATSGYTRGTNTLYVGCGDAAGNWGSDSITVSYNILAAVTGLKIVGGNCTLSGEREYSCSTSSGSATMSGSASVTGGTISSVAWSNSRGGSGTATGTATWSQSGLALKQGLNVITLTTTDELSLQTTYTINVTADIQRTWIRH